MAAVTANQIIEARNPGMLMTGPVEASTHLYAGTLCYFDNVTGNIVADDAVGTHPFAGIVKLEADNSSGANGDIDVEFYMEGIFTLTQDGTIDATEVGTLVEGINNNDVQDDDEAGAGSLVGRVVRRISATRVEVNIGQRA